MYRETALYVKAKEMFTLAVQVVRLHPVVLIEIYLFFSSDNATLSQ